MMVILSFILTRNNSTLLFLLSCFFSAKANVYEVLRRLLESHNSKLVCNFNRESVLYLSTVICRELKTCDVDVTSLTTQLLTTLLEYGIDPNKHLPDHIPLFAALKVGNVKISTLLLEASANVNITNSSGKSGLHIVFESNRVTGKSLMKHFYKI